MLTKCLPRLLPVITDIVNRSLDEAFIPNSLKTALIIPLLKKTNLNTEDFKNFRPVSNLPFISKLIEKSVAVQLVQYIEDNNLDEKLQSAYKKLHSTETALFESSRRYLTCCGSWLYCCFITTLSICGI